jgi:YD repeat-containing protein
MLNRLYAGSWEVEMTETARRAQLNEVKKLLSGRITHLEYDALNRLIKHDLAWVGRGRDDTSGTA